MNAFIKIQKAVVRLLLIAAFFAVSGCSGGSSGSGSTDNSAGEAQESLRIVFVTHGQASDPFWSVVQNGARDAGEDVNVDVEYQSPDSFDMVVMAQLIDAAVASRPAGLVVSLPDPDALTRPIQAAMKAGIPVISINSGNDIANELGVVAHVGQTEYEAGYGGGEEMAAAGITNALCVNQEVGNLGLDRRCEGFADAMEAAGASAEVLAVEMGDPTESQQRIQARLSSDIAIDGLLTLGPTTVQPALRALREMERTGQVQAATFDLSPEILDGIEAGDILFAIDQQQYLQGYLPVMMLSLHLRNANTFPNNVIRTGPAFVTAENVAQLRSLAQEGTR